jgi:uncharacterized protein YnzC (UPF0291/DUF896 family)
MTDKPKCTRAFENTSFEPKEIIEEYREHVKTCIDCTEIIDNLANQAFIDFTKKLF